MENWIKVCEYNTKNKKMNEWLLKLLEEENIFYEERYRGESIQKGKYSQYKAMVDLYIPKEYKEKVESYIKEYENPSNIVYEDAEELRNISVEEDDEEYKLTKISKKVIMWTFWGMISIIIIGMLITSMMS